MSTPKFVTDLIDDLSEEDRQRLAKILEIDQSSPAQLAEAMLPHAAAALNEYVSQYTGREVPHRIGELEQFRLLLLAKHRFNGVLPPPDTVVRIFHKNLTQAKNLIRNTAGRYRHELKDAMDAAAWNLVTKTAEPDEDNQWTIEIRDEGLLEHIRNAIRRSPGNPSGLRAPTKRQMHTYVLDRSTAEALAIEFGYSMKHFEDAVRHHGA